MSVAQGLLKRLEREGFIRGTLKGKRYVRRSLWTCQNSAIWTEAFDDATAAV